MADSGSPFDFGRYGQRPSGRPEPSPFPPPVPPRGLTDDDPRLSEPRLSDPRLSEPLSEPLSGAAVSVGRPPLVWVGLACASGLLGGLVATVWGAALTPALVAWLLAGPAAIGLLAFFTARDTAQRARPVYAGPAWTSLAYRVCIVVALLGLLLAAYRIADVVAR